MLFPFGVLEDAEAADIIFSELPALIFFSVYCLVVIRWVEIYHFTAKRLAQEFRHLSPVVIGANLFMYLAFCILLVIFLTKSGESVDVTCKTGYKYNSNSSVSEVIAIVYKIFFAVTCVILAILFGLYGTRLILLMRATGQAAPSRGNSRYNKYIRLILVTLVSTVALLVQAALLIYTSFNDVTGSSITNVVPIILFAEILPTIIFLYLFNGSSGFNRKPPSTGTKTSSTEGKKTPPDEIRL
eukprot:TRINITY_DN4524_c0_g1_i5.p1 TRINITY_DN4524_c0_g1~~TRINITY_DN4524_c0_g1_i5.p1  ORF type:complete len:242 (-),score=15.32 TRINITY_DN4524_c0_g1_i5:31-756(-)